MSVLICGSTSQSTTTHSANYFYLNKFEAQYTSTTVNEFRIYKPSTDALGVAYLKLGVYSNSTDNEAKDVLSHDDSTTLLVNSTGWNIFTIPTMSASSGVYYWLGFNSNYGTVIGRNNVGGTSRYVATSFTTFTFPDPASTTYTAGTLLYSMGIWGEISGGTSVPIAVFIAHYREQGII